MTVAPLQLPPIINVPKLDFSGLNEIGDAIAGYRQRSAVADSLPGLAGAQPQGAQPAGVPLNALGQSQPTGAQAATANGLSQDQMALLKQTADRYGIDPNYLVRTASIEGTSKNPNSSAQGLGQFIDGTARAYGVERGNDASAADALGRFTGDNKAALTKALGREPTPGELYLAHQQGAAGAVKLLTNPNAPAVAAVGPDAVVNNGGNPQMTAGQFASMWTGKFGDQAALPPNAKPAQYGAGQPAGAQPNAIQPNAGGIQPQTMAQLQAMIRAGGPAQQFAMALLQKYVVPQTPVAVGEGQSLVNPLTGQVVFQGTPKTTVVNEGGAAIDPRTGKVIYQAPEKPVIQPMGAQVIQNGKVVSGTTATGLLDDKSIADMARQYRAGDVSVMQNLGRGAQGAENIVKLRAEITRQNRDEGVTPEEQAMKNAEFFGVKAGQRTVGTKNANIELAATEFQQVLPIVQKASLAVSRTNYPDINKIIQAYQEHTGDPNVVAFGGAINTIVNLYGRAISPNGVATVSDKDHAREILQKAWSQGQFDAAVGMMKQEIDAALNSPEKVRQQMRERFLGGTQKPTQNQAETPSLPTFASPQDVFAAMKSGKIKSGEQFMTPDGQIRIAK